jgi:hypothetical protein
MQIEEIVKLTSPGFKPIWEKEFKGKNRTKKMKNKNKLKFIFNYFFST